MNEGRRQTARNLLAAATRRPWRWADWGAAFGTREREEQRVTLEYHPTYAGERNCIIRVRGDGVRKVFAIEEPIEKEVDALLLVEAPVLLEEALDEIDRLEKRITAMETRFEETCDYCQRRCPHRNTSDPEFR